jgi:hypothetical protein
VAYIDEHRDRFGVEPICRTLAAAGIKIAPSTYYSAKTRQPSARALRDAVMMPILLTLWVANYRVYGARKLWKAARRAGHEIGRDQVARLMRQLGIRGVKRGRRVITTRRDDQAARHDLSCPQTRDLTRRPQPGTGTWDLAEGRGLLWGHGSGPDRVEPGAEARRRACPPGGGGSRGTPASRCRATAVDDSR